MTPPRTYGWHTWRDAVRETVLALLVGATIGVTIALVVHRWNPQLLVELMILAVFITLAARGLETALSWAIEQSRFPMLFRTILYVVGGWIGALVALTLPNQRAGFAADLFLGWLLMTALFAATVGFVLHHNRKRNDRIAAGIARLKEHEFAEKELEIAREMQQRLLPPPLVERDGFRVTARTRAAHMVGGDFYDVLRIGEHEAAIVAADVSGKGIAASLIMASCKAMIPFLAGSGGAAEVMHALNASLCEQLQRREFVAMVLIRFDPRSGRAEIVNAGMPDPLVLGAGGAVQPVVCSGDRLPLGAMRTPRYEPTVITLALGERLLLFSDGLPEATVEGTPIGYECIERIAARVNSVDAIVTELETIEGIQIEDDLTVVALERT